MSVRILIVEDEAPVREMVCFVLKQEQFECQEAADAQSAREVLAEGKTDLILMDWMLPDTSGIELTRELKGDSLTADIPIIMLTAKGEEDDKIRGLESGVEDYITKPFSPRELLARIKVILRRMAPHVTEDIVKSGDLTLDPRSHRVTAKGNQLELGPTEFRLLHFFMTHKDRVYSRTRLLDQVWGTNVFIEERTVDVHIRRLRAQLEKHELAWLIQTVRGAGYRFSETK